MTIEQIRNNLDKLPIQTFSDDLAVSMLQELHVQQCQAYRGEMPESPNEWMRTTTRYPQQLLLRRWTKRINGPFNGIVLMCSANVHG